MFRVPELLARAVAEAIHGQANMAGALAAVRRPALERGR